MIYKIAWKNVWRNKVRSFTVVASVAIGLICGIFFIAFMNGMTVQRINSAIKTEVSHLQIHNPQFLDDNEVQFIIPNSDQVCSALDTISSVVAYSSRLTITGMIGSPRSSEGVKINGIDYLPEKQVTNLHTKIIDSVPNYFGKSRPIIISKRLAEKLRVKLNSKVVLTFQSVEGDLTGAPFKVTAIYNTSNKMFDEMMVFVPRQKLAEIAGLEHNQVHEIAVLLSDNSKTESVVSALSDSFSGLSVKSWKQIMPELGMMVDMMDYMLYVFMIIILIALAFGIINTMLMAVLERHRELGMLMAIGMNKTRVFMMILMETIYMSLTGALSGMIIIYFIIMLLQGTGIDLSAFAEGMESYGYDTFVYPEITMQLYINIGIMVIITALIAAIYPARKALKLNPAVAMRVDG